MQKIEGTSLTDTVYERLRSMIVEGELFPGMKISKKELAEALAVSVTPVSEALSRLAGEKLVVQNPKGGLYVRTFSDNALADIYAIRAGTEGIAVRLCVAEASDQDLQRLDGFFASFQFPVPARLAKAYMDEDRAFHTTILQIARVPLLVDMDSFYGFMAKSYDRGLMRLPNETLSEHKAIIAAIKARDAVLACELMISHHLQSRDRLKSLASRGP